MSRTTHKSSQTWLQYQIRTVSIILLYCYYNDINNFYPLSNVFENIDGIVDYNHKENLFVDFNRERLIYHMCSNEGPNLTLNDINSDGKNDLLIPGSKGQLSVIYLSTEKGFTLDNRNNDTFKKYLNSYK